MPVSSVTFQEILDTIQEKNVILKIDIEGAECKVKIFKVLYFYIFF